MKQHYLPIYIVIYEKSLWIAPLKHTPFHTRLHKNIFSFFGFFLCFQHYIPDTWVLCYSSRGGVGGGGLMNNRKDLFLHRLCIVLISLLKSLPSSQTHPKVHRKEKEFVLHAYVCMYVCNVNMYVFMELFIDWCIYIFYYLYLNIYIINLVKIQLLEVFAKANITITIAHKYEERGDQTFRFSPGVL